MLRAFPPKAYDSLGIHCSHRPWEERIAEQSDLLDRAVAESGGWRHIVRSCQDWKRMHPGDWDMMADCVRHVRPRGRWRGKSPLRVIADRYGVAANTVMRKRRAFPGALADFILFSCIQDDDIC
jgi:hypothetical protein